MKSTKLIALFTFVFSLFSITNGAVATPYGDEYRTVIHKSKSWHTGTISQKDMSVLLTGYADDYDDCYNCYIIVRVNGTSTTKFGSIGFTGGQIDSDLYDRDMSFDDYYTAYIAYKLQRDVEQYADKIYLDLINNGKAHTVLDATTGSATRIVASACYCGSVTTTDLPTDPNNDTEIP